MIDLIRVAIEFILKVWGWVSGRSLQKLNSSRRALEEASRQAQIDGDLDELRRIRAEIEEIDRRISTGDY